jgi:polysaccharide pyruvyl transferase WcaK-like protein
MLIEIVGGGFDNKGAQLMLETVVSRLDHELPDLSFCVETMRPAPPSDMQRLRIKMIFVRARSRYVRLYRAFLRASDILGRMVPLSFHQAESEARHAIDALVDMSGFAYGDAWTAKRTQIMARKAEYYARRGKPVIFLPQMFGTFEGAEIRRAMRRLCAAADLVYARDEVSYRCVQDLLSGPTDKLRQAPDITIFAEPDRSTVLPQEPYACIVPNIRVLSSGAPKWRENYISELLQAIRLLRSRGLGVVLMEHETGGKDRRLIEQLRSESSGDGVSICDYSSPFQLKAVLGGARVVLASRYHAAVSAVSSATPTVVLGWAHKYDTLMADFGVHDCIHRASDGWPHLEGLLCGLLDDQQHRARQAVLRERKQAMSEANVRMWTDVINALTNK